jgi:PAS domain S-box-containing protein
MDNKTLLDALRAAPSAVAVFDQRGELVFHTHQLMEAMPQIKKGLISFLDSLIKQSPTEVLLEALAECQEVDFIARLTDDPRYWEVHIDGGPNSTVTPVFIRDVTQREEADRINRILLELIERSLDPIGIARPDHSGLYVNPAMRRLFGVDHSVPAAHLRIEDVQSNIGSSDVSSALQEALDHGPYYAETLIHRRDDHRDIHALQMLLAHHDPLDNQVYFSTAIHDITEAKSLERELQRARNELEQLLMARTEEWLRSSRQAEYAQHVWRSLVDRNPDLVLFTDQHGEILFANQGFLPESGLALIGKQAVELFDVEDTAHLRDAFHQLVHTGKVHFSAEAKLLAPTGSQYYCALSVNYIAQKDGAHAATWMISDITAERQAREQLAISEQIAASGRMAARVAHEINNPLGAIKNSVSLIRMDIPADSEAREYLDLMERELARVADIIRQMYSLYQGNREAAQTIEPTRVCKEVVKLLRAQASSRHITIRTNADTRVQCKLAESSLRQVLYNVIINAMDASPDHAEILITISQQQNQVVITVMDQGRGIDPSSLQQLFEPFYTTKETYSGRGLGLGLPVSLSIVRSLGGDLTLEPCPGGGTCCRILLPISPPH